MEPSPTDRTGDVQIQHAPSGRVTPSPRKGLKPKLTHRTPIGSAHRIGRAHIGKHGRSRVRRGFPRQTSYPPEPIVQQWILDASPCLEKGSVCFVLDEEQCGHGENLGLRCKHADTPSDSVGRRFGDLLKTGHA